MPELLVGRLTGDDSDEALVEAARNGDKEAMGLLLSRYRSAVVALCQRALSDSALAEDAAQEAALLSFLNIDRLRRPNSFRSWLCGIALNICRRWREERSHEVWSWETLKGGVVVESFGWALDPSPEDLAEAADIRRSVRLAVSTLPPGQRAAVVLFYLSGLTYRETAMLLNIPIGAVKARLHKGRAALRQRLWHLWREENMVQETRSQFVRMRVIDARRAKAEDHPARHVVLLEEIGGSRRFPIWMGRSEATWIALSLEHVELPRPGSYQFTNSILKAAGGRLKEVRIARVTSDHTVYAEAVIESASGTTGVDARPSDALNLALISEVPIYVDASVLEGVRESEWGRRILEEDSLARDYPDGPREIVAEFKR